MVCSTTRSVTDLRFSCGCARPARRNRRGCALSRAPTKSNWSPARRASRLARPAYSTMRLRDRHACLAAGLSRARLRRAKLSRPDRLSKRCADKKFRAANSGRGMGNDIDRAGVAKAYGRWAPVYDLVFGKVFEQGRQSTIAEADKIGGRILDVGVGTGLSLSDYSRSTKLCGVDISE